MGSRRLIHRVIRPRRSFLYVPGHSERKISKAIGSDIVPDVICLDLEDGVSHAEKDEARENIVATLPQLMTQRDPRKTEVAVRINARTEHDNEEVIIAPSASSSSSSSSSSSFSDNDNGANSLTGIAVRDLDAVFSSNALPDAFVLPKCESAEDFSWLADELQERTERWIASPSTFGNSVSMSSSSSSNSSNASSSSSKPRNISEMLPHGIAMIGMIESSLSLARMGTLVPPRGSISSLDRSLGSSSSSGDIYANHLSALIFGGDDYAADCGMLRTDTLDIELSFPRSFFLMHCKALNVQAIDAVQIGFRESERFIESSEMSAAEGFDGRQCIHPNQISPANEAYSPSERQVARARAIVDSLIGNEGKGAFSLVLDGQDIMIDMPTIKNARGVLARAGVVSE